MSADGMGRAETAGAAAVETEEKKEAPKTLTDLLKEGREKRTKRLEGATSLMDKLRKGADVVTAVAWSDKRALVGRGWDIARAAYARMEERAQARKELRKEESAIENANLAKSEIADSVEGLRAQMAAMQREIEGLAVQNSALEQELTERGAKVEALRKKAGMQQEAETVLRAAA